MRHRTLGIRFNIQPLRDCASSVRRNWPYIELPQGNTGTSQPCRDLWRLTSSCVNHGDSVARQAQSRRNRFDAVRLRRRGPETAAARHRDRVRRRRRRGAEPHHALGDGRVAGALCEGARGPGDGFPERLTCRCRQQIWAQHGHPRLGRGDVAQDPRPRRPPAHVADADS